MNYDNFILKNKNFSHRVDEKLISKKKVNLLGNDKKKCVLRIYKKNDEIKIKYKKYLKDV